MQKFAKNPFGTDIPEVEFYIMKYETEKQARLLKIRAAAKKRNPDATERIYYGIPTVELDGKIILQYAACKSHISLLVGNALPKILREKYPQFNYTDYTVIFPDKEPFPDALLEEICTMLGAQTGEDYYAKCHRNE